MKSYLSDRDEHESPNNQCHRSKPTHLLTSIIIPSCNIFNLNFDAITQKRQEIEVFVAQGTHLRNSEDYCRIGRHAQTYPQHNGLQPPSKTFSNQRQIDPQRRHAQINKLPMNPPEIYQRKSPVTTHQNCACKAHRSVLNRRTSIRPSYK